MFPIVGVGASAGGLEAFVDIIRHVPPDAGLAFVFVQHYDPKHKSVAPEILSRATRLRVLEATEGARVRSNHVYVIPPNAELRIRGGALRLSPRRSTGGEGVIDRFLESLANDRQENAIGVILSGMSSDGAKGIEAVRNAGGHTLAQDDLTAKFTAMPRSAIDTGAVESILSPQGIADSLLRLAKHDEPLALPSIAIGMRSASPDLLKVLSILRATSGVDFTRYKPGTLERRIRRRMTQVRVPTLDEYASFLSRNKAEGEALYHDLLIHVTSFFRNGNTFAFLEKQVFPALLKHRSPRDPIRIWVPACSTGEEPYSIAMLLREYMEAHGPKVPFQIFATDVSAGAIQKARAGIYPDQIANDVGLTRLRRFFVKTDRGYQVSKSIRESIIFATHDVTRDPPFSRMDLISCRNLMIYLGPELQARVIPTFHYALKPKGFLLLGPAETIGSFTDLFAVLDRKRKVFTKKAGPSNLIEFSPRATLVDPPTRPPLSGESTLSPDVRHEADRLVLARFAPAGVIVNENFEVMHFRGKTGGFLEHPPGEARLSLFKMAREGLLPVLRATLERARKTNLPSRSKRVRLGREGRGREIIIEAVPLKAATPQRQFLVLFEEADKEPRIASKVGIKKGAHPQTREPPRVKDLEEELAATKQYLQSVIESQEAVHEELQSAHEEALSNNEELQSTNEELETAQEELQSANEELTTLNEELQNRNASLAQLYNDVNNLVKNIDIPIVIVGNDLRIRRFTPAAEKVFNLIVADIGRPLGNIRSNLDLNDIEGFVRDAMTTVSLQEADLRDNEGRRFSLRVRPYRTADNQIDGAVIVLVDVEELKSSLEHVTESRDLAQGIVETVQQPLAVLDKDLRLIHANGAFHLQFPAPPGELHAKKFFDINGGQWDTPRLRERVARLAADGSSFDGVQIELLSPRGPPQTVRVSARRLRPSNWPGHLLLTIEDVTAEKAAEENLRKLNEDLEAFSYSVTHDLRTPLHAIRGFAQSLIELKGQHLDADGRHYADNILEGASRMSHLIEDLLQLSWASRGDLKKDHVDVSALAAVITQRIGSQEPDRKVTVSIMPGLNARADPRLLEIVLENLLANAWKFTKQRKDAKIEVGVIDADGSKTFYIRDNGVGFDMAYASRLFQAFQRLHPPGQFPGTGIGLATVKRVIHRHDGRAWAESAPGKGATFFFTLSG